MIRFLIHYGLHFVAPYFIATLYAKHSIQEKYRVYILFLASMLVDLDHLVSDPVFDPHRLSVGHHFLHSYYALALYAFALFYKRTRLLAFALIFHMFSDIMDYLLYLIGL